MVRRLVPFAAAGLAASGLALAGPIAAHAQVCNNGLQSSVGQGVTGTHHAFDHSHDNCVVFDANNNSAYLHDGSNDNLIQFESGATHNSVDEFRNSSGNEVQFIGNGNTLSATNTNGTDQALVGSNDVVTEIGLSNAAIDVEGSNDFLVFDSGCNGVFTDVPPSFSGFGSASNPITIC